MAWLLFLIIGIVHLVCLYAEISMGSTVTKCLLVPAAMLGLYLQTGLRQVVPRIVFAGLLLGWAGDMFLLGKSIVFFALGLVSFLLGHILYIRAFSKEVSLTRSTHLLMEKPYIILPFLAMLIHVVCKFSPHITGIPAFPVYLYAFVILLMALMAINRWYAVHFASWLTVLTGALLFIISDYALSVKFFIGNYPYSSLIIMASYIPAQGLIAYGTAVMYSKPVSG